MTTKSTFLDDARAVHDFIAAHPELPEPYSIEHRPRPFTYGSASTRRHNLVLPSGRSISSTLAWHDALNNPAVVLDSYTGDGGPSVHINITGLLPTGQDIHVYVGVFDTAREALRHAAGLTLGEKDKRVDVEVLRALVDITAAGAVA